MKKKANDEITYLNTAGHEISSQPQLYPYQMSVMTILAAS